jgi:predicted ABC-type transport system involved in lysophospholipase L1 biosynthesis ATPase subunit
MGYIKGLKCRECHRIYPTEAIYVCEFCFGSLEVDYDYDKIKSAVSREKIEKGPKSIWRYRELLPIDKEPTVGFHSGFTPLFKADNLARVLGMKELYVKDDSVCHPTLSFKDRVVAVALTRAKELGFIFQGFNLLATMTALENVVLAGDYAGLAMKDAMARARQLLNDVGLGERLDHFPSELSGGEQQRVAIARSLMNDGRMILADEPTGELDTKNSELIVGLLRDLVKRKHKTIVMVTHNEDLTRFCDRTIKIVDGVLAT